MKLKNIFFVISFVGIFNITYAGWFDGDEKNEEIEEWQKNFAQVNLGLNKDNYIKDIIK